MSLIVLRFFYAFCCCFSIGSAIAGPLQISIGASQTVGAVDVSLTNYGPEPVSFLVWDTPFEQTLSHNVFLVKKAVEGFPLMEVSQYTGRIVKRAEPSAEHYRVIQPGEMIVSEVVLNEYYDISRFGNHLVQFAGDIRYEKVSGLQTRSKSALSSVETLVNAKLMSGTTTVNLAPKLTSRLRPPTYDSCSVQERADIVEAATIAETLTNTAINDLRGLSVSERTSSARYNEWFGAYSEARFNKVVSNFNAIDQALEDETLQFNCDCTESGIFAFVYPAFPYSITLCPSFRSARPDGQDSRAGTIIHELSHFTVVANTDDHVYGQSGAQALALSNPDTAVDNADSYEYFAENSPELMISQAGEATAPIEYSSLQLGVESQGTIAEGQLLDYQVSNANRVELVPNRGDADLYVYRDDQLTDQICISSSGGSDADVCEFFVGGTVYVRVRAFTDTTFSLTAYGDVQPAEDDGVVLSLGVVVSGSVEANNRNIYQVSGGEIVELLSQSGDADLYVFSSLDLSSDSLVCASNVKFEESDTDVCNIPISQSTYYISVVGYTTADYSLLARSATFTEVIRLTPGQAINGNVTEGGFQYYVVSGVGSVVLTSLTGDADLRVTTDSEYRETDTSCTSQAFIADSVVDSCIVTSSNDQYIFVFGYTAAEYTLIGNPGPTADDDPDTVPLTPETPASTPTSSASSSGGGIGGLGLTLLLTVFGFRVMRKGS